MERSEQDRRRYRSYGVLKDVISERVAAHGGDPSVLDYKWAPRFTIRSGNDFVAKVNAAGEVIMGSDAVISALTGASAKEIADEAQ
jgi:hypothetical protein